MTDNHKISINATGANYAEIKAYVNDALVTAVSGNQLSYNYPVNSAGGYSIYAKGINSLGTFVSSPARAVTVSYMQQSRRFVFDTSLRGYLSAYITPANFNSYLKRMDLAYDAL